MIEKRTPSLRVLDNAGKDGNAASRSRKAVAVGKKAEALELRIVASNGSVPEGREPESEKRNQQGKSRAKASPSRTEGITDQLNKPWAGILTALLLILLFTAIIVVFGN